MLRFFSAERHKKIDVLYRAAQDARIMSNRKVVIISCLKMLGYHEDVLILPMANISLVYSGYSPVDGWVVRETSRNPKNKTAGYVVCIRNKE